MDGGNEVDDFIALFYQSKSEASVWGSDVATLPLQMKMEFTNNNGQWIISKQIASTY